MVQDAAALAERRRRQSEGGKKGAAKRWAHRRAFWRQLIARQEESGLSVEEFCAREEVRRSSFFSWRRRFSGQEQDGPLVEQKRTAFPARAAKPEPAGFVELVPEEWLRVRSGVRIMLPGHIGIELDRGFDPEALGSALAVVVGSS